MLGTFVTLPDTFASTTLGYTGSFVSDFSTLIAVIVGVMLSVLAITFLIRVFTHH